MFTIGSEGLRKLLRVNQFPDAVPDRMMFFGFRGCVPADPEDQRFGTEARLREAEVNYLNPRCTLVQWKPGEGLLAAYPGSTVPHRRYVSAALGRGGLGANQLMTGAYPDYRKGIHRPGTPSAHEAFRETGERPYLRTADDLRFENDDRVDFDNPSDNLHAAWSHGLTDGYSSAGCQVVVGFPETPARSNQPSTGPWKAFHDAAYAASQDRFVYVLLDSAHVERVAADPSRPYTARVRYGSQGSLVQAAQAALKDAKFYEGRIDGDFGLRTLRALLAFQRKAFGAGSADGIMGPQTAAAIGIHPWPTT